MGKEVYANGNEICCKACKGKTSSAFPDPCWSAPPSPTGPIVIPYANFSKPSSLKKGSKTVFIKGTMVALADQSYFSISTGNEPATQAFRKGILTHVLKGKTYYKKWSQNVKFEGKGVCRNFDLMSHNHDSAIGNTASFPFLAKTQSSNAQTDPCGKDKERIEKECAHPDPELAAPSELKAWDWKTVHCKGILTQKRIRHAAVPAMLDSIELIEGQPVADKEHIRNRNDVAEHQTNKAKENDCLKAKKCELVSYESSASHDPEVQSCCSGQTGHHLIGDKMIDAGGCEYYSFESAPTVCAEGVSHSIGSHGDLHTNFSRLTQDKFIANQGEPLSRSDAIDCAVQSHAMAFPNTGCNEGCIKTQLEAYYAQCPDTKYFPVEKTGRKLSSEKCERLLKEIGGLDSLP